MLLLVAPPVRSRTGPVRAAPRLPVPSGRVRVIAAQAAMTGGPLFTVGTLTASGAPFSVLTAGAAASVLSAATTPGSTLTATSQRTGGPS